MSSCKASLIWLCWVSGFASRSLFNRVLFFQAEDGIRDLVRSRGLGDVYKRQQHNTGCLLPHAGHACKKGKRLVHSHCGKVAQIIACLLYTSDAADERSSVDLGGRRIIKKNTYSNTRGQGSTAYPPAHEHRCTARQQG